VAQAATTNSIITHPCELTLRLQLRKAGLRLDRTGYGYRLIFGNQVLLDRRHDGRPLTLDDVAYHTRQLRAA
jgi:hypothetical protein